MSELLSSTSSSAPKRLGDAGGNRIAGHLPTNGQPRCRASAVRGPAGTRPDQRRSSAGGRCPPTMRNNRLPGIDVDPRGLQSDSMSRRADSSPESPVHAQTRPRHATALVELADSGRRIRPHPQSTPSARRVWPRSQSRNSDRKSGTDKEAPPTLTTRRPIGDFPLTTDRPTLRRSRPGHGRSHTARRSDPSCWRRLTTTVVSMPN